MTGAAEPKQDDAIRAFYGSYVTEQWTRFDRYARVEEYVLNRALSEKLPGPPAHILDIGGGNGRHAFHLANNGYRISLCDMTEGLLEDARQRNMTSKFPLAEIVFCDARELAWPDEYADAALLLGPMYCVQDSAKRAAVLREARRVLSPGAPLFIQFLSRIPALRSLLEVAAVVAGAFDWQSFIRDGVFSDSWLPDFFRLHYFTTPAEALAEVEDAGFHATAIRGMDGPASIFGQRALMDAPEEIIRQWGEVAWAIGADPEYRSTSTHLLAVTYR